MEWRGGGVMPGVCHVKFTRQEPLNDIYIPSIMDSRISDVA